MPIYEYEHVGTPCSWGKIFEIKQSINDEPLTHCLNCNGEVRKKISLIAVNISRSNSELRDLGFTKLVKREDGVYENMTRRNNDSRYVKQDDASTLPNLSHLD